MKVENHAERQIEIGGWEVHLRTYQIGDIYYCKADNVSPGREHRTQHRRNSR